eukprot:2226367-Pleurochrysis_carterae.AAC.1
MMWVLRIKKDEKGDQLKYKARAVVCGNQQKCKATALGSEHTLETFAPAARLLRSNCYVQSAALHTLGFDSLTRRQPTSKVHSKATMA